MYSGAIARHVIKAQSNRQPANTSYEMHSEMARAFLGNEMADALGLHRSLKHRIYTIFIMGFVKYFSYILLPFKKVGSDSIKRTKRALRYVINKVLYPEKLEKLIPDTSNHFLKFE
jgi:hypothetical protein